jgi:hypothetical protein
MSGESLSWINHFHFTVARTLCERHFRHLERHIIPSKRERGKEITIKFRNIIFNVGYGVWKSILINILIKNTILKWFVIIIVFFYSFFLSSTFKINKDLESSFCFCLYCIYYFCCLVFFIGTCTPKQVNGVVVNLLGINKDCGMIINRVSIHIHIY